MNSLIFYVLRALRSAEQEAGIGELDVRARELLRLIGEEHAVGSPLSVGGVVRRDVFGTAPTVFKLLRQLEDDGWIERSPDEDDARGRKILLTRRTRKAYARASKLASDVLRSETE